ncbi:Thiol-disulfide oxidoreductase ResA [Caloramator mitchellensis]|uniref:Thiol-disulfide oxidoreductase ResA n=1 Tax=Caloramator mitchellensis TaxID=908809 RepID=A0A0R3JS86_CALMK|nr:TlpA disulfide reductase family protein [Caloramator mitchellensis]KRQ86345.1 Thiol-disulfide oxidoreductase ResA [Caloramator mitchellensis]
MNKKSIYILIIVFLVVLLGYSFTKLGPSSGEQNIQNINEQTNQSTLEGAKDFELENLNGDKVKLSDYKGKVIVLNFFATWCPPCKAELPGFVKVVEEYKDKDVVFLFVDVGEDNSTVKGFLDENGYKFTPLMDYDGKVSDMYGVRGIPTTFIISKGFEQKEQHVGFMDEGTLKDLIDAALW